MNCFSKFEKLRQDFPMLRKCMHGHPLVYLDSAATAQKPQAVIDTITDFYQNHYGTVHRAIYELATFSTREYEDARKKVQNFINAESADEIIFTRGTTESINMVAYSFGKAFLNEGDEILISEMEHHSNIVPWQLACEDRGAVLKVAPIDDRGELIMEEFKKLLTSRTKIVALTHISNALGTVNPIKDIAALAHACGAVLLVDGAQAAPHMPVDVRDLDADFYVFSGHKIYGPTGIGILYGKASLLQQMPPYQGGGDMIEKVTFEKTTFNILPLKFEAGTPMIAEAIALGAAIDYLTDIGMVNAHAWEQELLCYATDRILEVPGLKIIGNAARKGGIISFVIDGLHHLDVGTILDFQGIAVRTGHHCAQPLMKRFGLPGTARVSFALYNSKADIDRFIAGLHHVIKTLKR
ncbi:MAG: cysteine desulfurase [Parachlamydiaceae bacterium]|nr:cysteine desulfurase [Parachlamydiaceae bacterium]